MRKAITGIRGNTICLIFLLFFSSLRAAPPTNDSCSGAFLIPVPAGGFGLGNFSSVQADLTDATVESGESFAPAVFVAGLDKKSVWFRFRISTIRAVRVTLTQPGTVITAGDAGFTVYQAGNCLPGNAAISTKLTPIVTFGNTYHPCVPAGEYLVQVSGNFNANGPVQVLLEISDQTGAAYDHPAQAFAFDTIRYYANRVEFNTECQSIEDSSEICSAFSNPYRFHKSAWLTFTTPTYFDYIVFQLSSNNGSYFPSNNGTSILRHFGYSLYQGDAVSTPLGSLTPVRVCDSLATDGYYAAYRMFKCDELQRATTYSIQIFIDKDFADDIRVGLLVGGRNPTRAPLPEAPAVPAPNAIGILPASPAGVQTFVDDVWACNSRHRNAACGPAMPDSGLLFNGIRYNLSSFFTFSLTGAAAVSFYSFVTQCGPTPITSVYRQGLTLNCTGLDTANLLARFTGINTLDCLEPGNYVVQVSGYDATDWYARFNTNTALYNSEQCLSSNLGTPFRLDLRAYSRNAANRFSLAAPGQTDSVNAVGGVLQPLTAGVPYPTSPDTMGCQQTVLPADTSCAPVNTKAMYRQFVVGDSGVVDLSNLQPVWWTSWRYRLYQGDATALATAQNLFSFPGRFTGLQPVSDCMDGNTQCYNKTVCVTPGMYTLTTLGGISDVGRADRPTLTFTPVRTKHASPFTAQDMGSIWDTLGAAGGTLTSDLDVWSCSDNAVPVNGYQPCTVGGRPATKAIYRQFYLNQPSLVRIDVPSYWYCANRAYGLKTLFYGRATDGLTGLAPVDNGWNCFQYSAGNTAGCNLLPAGWYTVISYNHGPSYDSTTRGLNLEGRYNSAVSYYDEFRVTVTPTCKGPSFNRPFKASVAAGNQPHLIQPVNRTGHTAAFPRTDSSYALPAEFFNCTVDTPFAGHPVNACGNTANRVAYYVFRTVAECFLYINTSGYAAALFEGDVRTDSAQFSTRRPLSPCTTEAGYIQYCYFQPGTYTLVIFATDANICQSVRPVIMAETIGYSRFDFAAQAYDFGEIPPDATYHFGKTGDVNPINPLRKPSSDFFYCTTGADSSNPAEPVCNTRLNPNVYNSGPNKPLYDSAFPPSNGPVRRNLWYTFVVTHPGDVKVKVDNKHDLRGYQPKFAVYRSNVDASLPFSTVVSSGQVDSTTAQGLTLVGVNPVIYWPGYCFQTDDEVSFYRDPCSAVPTRYYVLVENVNAQPSEPGGTLPNTQIEVSVLLDSISLVLPKYDHYYQAGDLGTVGVGTYTGETDNYSCATWDGTEPVYNYATNPACRKTLWYKFTSTVTGNVRYRVFINGTVKYDYYDVQIFRDKIPGDSTAAGLELRGYTTYYDNSNNSYWAETCVAPGTYYLLLTGCGQLNQYVYPQIQLVENVGDFCGRAVPASLSGPGNVNASVLVNCHTIGTDYGEFGPTLTCPENGVTGQFKTSWFRMDIGGTDTLDVTTFLVENTNAASSDIKYRMMTGDCGAMQEQSCVLDALTQNTYQCLAPGQSYYIQVFTPVTKFSQAVTGTIELRVSAVVHADTCSPPPNCLASANFLSQFNCQTDDSVKFLNYSTYGTAIRYTWDFGNSRPPSAEVSPLSFYPALPHDSTYFVKLKVENISCGRVDSVVRPVTVPARPYIEFGADRYSCAGNPVTLFATSHTGATWLWNNNSTADSLRFTNPGVYNAWVQVDYNNCRSRDTVQVVLSPLNPRPLQQLILCGDSVQLNSNRNTPGVTYRWLNGEVTPSIFADQPGIYWVDIRYYNCIYRDSFVVNSVSNANPLGNDTTLCSGTVGYILRATTSGAQSYQWNDNSTSDTLRVQLPGTYSVTIRFSACEINDTILINAAAPAQQQVLDTSICQGNTLLLPWGIQVQVAGSYTDTLRSVSGCDSLIRRVNLGIYPRPDLGRDTSVCLAVPFVLQPQVQGSSGYSWQDGSTGNSFTVNLPGLYWVDAQFPGCRSRDSILISGAPAPLLRNFDTSTCTGSLLLPWGETVFTSGIYRDTVRSWLGCDSILNTAQVTFNTPPNPGNDSVLRTCGVRSVNLLQLYPAGVNQHTWTLNNMLVADPANVQAPGTYLLVATGTGGCKDSLQLTLEQLPQPQLGADTSLAVCSPASVNLTSLYPAGNNLHTWSSGGMPVPDPAAVNVSGLYRVVAVAAGGCADSAEVTIMVNLKPDLGSDRDTAACIPALIPLTAMFNTSFLQTAWDTGGIPVLHPQAVSTGGVYRLTVQNNEGCRDTALVNVQFHPAPVLGNDSIIAVCAPATVNLTGIYTVSGLQTSWSLGGLPYNDPASARDPGIYRLVAVSAQGCSDTARVTVVIHPKPALGNDTMLLRCPGSFVDLAGLYPAAQLVKNWYRGADLLVPPVADQPGVYRLEAENAAGCLDTARVTLAWHPGPRLGPEVSARVCSGAVFNLDTVRLTGNDTRVWTFAGNPVAQPSAVSLPGIYRLEAVNPEGCRDTLLLSLAVEPLPVLQLNNPAPLCLPQQADLTLPAVTAGSAPGLSFSYWRDAASLDSLPHPAAVDAGIYFIRGVSAAGCSSSAPVQVSSYPLPLPDAGPDQALCFEDSILLLRGSAGNTTVPPAYSWEPVTDGGIGQPFSSTTRVQPVRTPLAYILTVTDGYGCNYRVSDTVIVFRQPPVQANAGNDTLVPAGLPYRLQAGGGTDYSWSPAGLLDNPRVPDPVAVIRTDSVRFTVTVKDDRGCEGYDEVLIRTLNGITYYVPNAFTPNGDGLNDYFRPIPVGIVSTQFFRVFNRYGELLFESASVSPGWDGTYRGKAQPPANYVWVLRGMGRNGKMITLKGNLLLIR